MLSSDPDHDSLQQLGHSLTTRPQPRSVIGLQQESLWLAHGTTTVKCSEGHIRHATASEQLPLGRVLDALRAPPVPPGRYMQASEDLFMDHDEPPLKRSRDTSSSTQPSAFANPNEFVQRAQNVSVPLPRTPEQPSGDTLSARRTSRRRSFRSLASISDSPHLRHKNGPPTLRPRTTFPLHRNWRPSPRRAHASSLSRTKLQKVLPPPPAATTLQRTEQGGVLRSAQWRRATELCPHRLAQQSNSSQHSHISFFDVSHPIPSTSAVPSTLLLRTLTRILLLHTITFRKLMRVTRNQQLTRNPMIHFSLTLLL